MRALHVYFLGVALAAVVTSVAAQEGAARPAEGVGPRLVITPEHLELGPVYWGKSISGEVVLSNGGDEPLVIHKVQSTCGCTAASLAPEDRTLAPGASVTLPVTMTPKGPHTPLLKRVKFESNDRAQSHASLPVQCDVKVGVNAEPSNLLFRDLEEGDVRSMPVVLESLDGEPFAIESVTFSSELYRVEYTQDAQAMRHVMTVTTGPIERRQYATATMTLRTTHSQTPLLKYNANSLVLSLVEKSGAHLVFGKIPEGREPRRTMQLWERKTGAPLTEVTARVAKYPDVKVLTRRDEADPRTWHFTAEVPEALVGQTLSSAVVLKTNVSEEGPITMMFGITIMPGRPASGSR